MILNLNQHKWFINKYSLIGQNIRPYTPLMDDAKSKEMQMNVWQQSLLVVSCGL